MKLTIKFFALALALFMPLMCSCQTSTTFFKTQNSADWFYILNNKALNPTDVFKMNDGVLTISGESSGYVRTTKKYSNFTLDAEWRWTKTAGNSGVLVHIQPLDTVWPACFQIQQKTTAVGELICMKGQWAKECTDSVRFTVKTFNPPTEKPLGEWNSMRVISKDGTLKVWINGVYQNSISGMTSKEGYIGFQNEGKPLEFRNVTVK